VTAPIQLAMPHARRPRPKCRVCEGRRLNTYGAPCSFCRRGVARFVCPTCGEALPCCACFGEMRAVP